MISHFEPIGCEEFIMYLTRVHVGWEEMIESEGCCVMRLLLSFRQWRKCGKVHQGPFTTDRKCDANVKQWWFSELHESERFGGLSWSPVRRWPGRKLPGRGLLCTICQSRWLRCQIFWQLEILLACKDGEFQFMLSPWHQVPRQKASKDIAVMLTVLLAY